MGAYGPLSAILESKIGDGVFRIPPPQITLMPDGAYKVSVGSCVQFVSSAHLIDEHIIQLERIYRKRNAPLCPK